MLVTDKQDEVIGKDICLHIASSAPEFLSRNDILQKLLKKKQELKWV